MQPRRFAPLVIPLLASGLLAAFFLPWFVIFGERASGYALARLGDIFVSVWIVPALAITTLALSFARRCSTGVALVAGLSPFVLLACLIGRLYFSGGTPALIQGGKIARQLASSGAYLTLLCGAALVFVSWQRLRSRRAGIPLEKPPVVG